MIQATRRLKWSELPVKKRTGPPHASPSRKTVAAAMVDPLLEIPGISAMVCMTPIHSTCFHFYADAEGSFFREAANKRAPVVMQSVAQIRGR